MRFVQSAARALVPRGLQLTVAASGLSLAILVASPASAASEPAAYEAEDFERAQAEGRTIIVESYAFWCLPCRIQAPILDQIRKSAPFDRVTVLRIGEVTPGRVWKQFRLTAYGTLVVFRGRQEVARGTPTTEAAVATLIRNGL